MSTKFHPNPSTTFWGIVLYIVFGPISQRWRITLQILVTGSGSVSSPKSNQFILVTHWTCPQLFEISCTQRQRCENMTSFAFGGGGNNTTSHLGRWFVTALTKTEVDTSRPGRIPFHLLKPSPCGDDQQHTPMWSSVVAMQFTCIHIHAHKVH